MTDCSHPEIIESKCTTCGVCVHDVILNRACFYCGTEDLDPEQLSPKKVQPLIDAASLTAKLRRNK